MANTTISISTPLLALLLAGPVGCTGDDGDDDSSGGDAEGGGSAGDKGEGGDDKGEGGDDKGDGGDDKGTEGDACAECVLGSCADEVLACTGDEACNCYSECAKGGDETTCLADCSLEEIPPGFTEMDSCVNDNCSDVC